jgi:microcystin degradation protein MlrC
MARIAVGGWQHETNTFAPTKADFEAFARFGEWPGLCRGADMLATVAGVHLPVTGIIERLAEAGHELVPLLWASATPSAHVTEDAYERISAMLLDHLAAAPPLDGVCLDLHGAMVCEHLEDGEGEILRRVREVVGADLPLTISLDLHANVTPAMVEHADVIDIFRTYPHVDMAATGRRAAEHLLARIAGAAWHKAYRRPEFLIPLNWGCTLTEPAGGLYRGLPGRIGDGVAVLALACGFSLADIAEVGPAILAYGADEGAVDAAADTLLRQVNEREGQFSGPVYPPDEVVAEARRLAERAHRPVVIADSQDNPGGGGPGDTTGLLRALVAGGARGAVVGVISDPEVARLAHGKGVGSRLRAPLGDKSGMPGHVPYEAELRVLALADGKFTATGPMYKGARMQLGPMALLEVEGVRVLVGSKPVQTADQAIFRHVGIEPSREAIIALKSSVHFRADFQPIAEAILIAAAPGPVYSDHSGLTFRNIRPGVRVQPGGLPVKEGTPHS